MCGMTKLPQEKHEMMYTYDFDVSHLLRNGLATSISSKRDVALVG